MQMMEEDEPLSSSEAPRACTGHGGRPVDTSSGPRNTLQTDILYARPHADRGTCDSAAVRRGAGAQRTCLCVRRAAGMLRACYRHAANALTVHPRVQMLIQTSALLQTGTNCQEMSWTDLEMDQQMEQERLAILGHPVVNSISDVDRSMECQVDISGPFKCHV